MLALRSLTTARSFFRGHGVLSDGHRDRMESRRVPV
jgi:hypothetical protein